MAVLLGNSVAAMAADDFKVSQLEQDVRDLQRQVNDRTTAFGRRVCAIPVARTMTDRGGRFKFSAIDVRPGASTIVGTEIVIDGGMSQL